MTASLEQDWLATYPDTLRAALAAVVRGSDQPFYVAGGAVRDWVLGRAPRDLDLTVARQAIPLARDLAHSLGAAFVLLDEREGAARVVWQGYTIDFSQFRDGALTIADDLIKRDFTVNALAVAVAGDGAGLLAPYSIIDPAGGLADLAAGLIRVPAPESFRRDPLRLLRAFRFQACMGFVIEPDTARQIVVECREIQRAAAERIACELDLIMAAPGAAIVVEAMAASGLLFAVLPELRAGVGMEQPASHHLDVFRHGLRTLECLEDVTRDPGCFFPGQKSLLVSYLADEGRVLALKWAALFHDVGKPVSFAMRQGRITFYNHDRSGRSLFDGVARRLRFSRQKNERIGRLIAHHMWPFHLNNARRKTGITARACLRLVKSIGNDLPGLFLLAMADSLAGAGVGKPSGMEASLAELYQEVAALYDQRIKPVLASPLLLNGHDLRNVFGLTPGPLFRRLLDELEKAQVEWAVRSREQAIHWVERYLADHPGEK